MYQSNNLLTLTLMLSMLLSGFALGWNAARWVGEPTVARQQTGSSNPVADPGK